MQPDPAPEQSKVSKKTVARRAARISLSAIPVIVGGALVFFSSAAIPILFGLAAIAAGIYRASSVVRGWFKKQKSPAPEITVASVLANTKALLKDPQKRKKFRIKTAIAAILGAVKVGTGSLLAAKLAASTSMIATGLVVAAEVLSVLGAATAIGGAAAIIIVSVAAMPRFIDRANKFIDRIAALAPAKKQKKPSADAPAAEKTPISGAQLDQAKAKTQANFNEASAPPSENDNTPPAQSQKPQHTPPAP